MTAKNPNHDELFSILRDFQNGALVIGDAQKAILNLYGAKEEVLGGPEEAQLPGANGPAQVIADEDEDEKPAPQAKRTRGKAKAAKEENE